MSVIPTLKGRDRKPSFKASLSYIVSLRQTSAISDLVTKDSLSFSPSLLPSPLPHPAMQDIWKVTMTKAKQNPFFFSKTVHVSG